MPGQPFPGFGGCKISDEGIGQLKPYQHCGKCHINFCTGYGSGRSSSRHTCITYILHGCGFPQISASGAGNCVKSLFSIRPDLPLIVKILAIGVPSGIENGMFQFGKLAIQSTVSTLGTAAIAAQAMAIIFENVNGVAGIGIGIGLMTVVGQAIGAGRKEEAKYYIVKLSMYAELAIIFPVCLCLQFQSRSCFGWNGV